VLERTSIVNNLMFYPYFSGGSFPLNDANCRAAFVGLDLSHDRFDMARAIMEGVAMQTAWIIDHFDQRAPVHRIKLSGGAAKSGPWMQMIANIIGRPINALSVQDLPCVGAAIIAGVGSGAFDSFKAGIDRMNMNEYYYQPNRGDAEKYRAKLKKFTENADAIRRFN